MNKITVVVLRAKFKIMKKIVFLNKKIKTSQVTNKSSFALCGVNVSRSNQMADITRQWWRRLVNACELKAGMVCLHVRTENSEALRYLSLIHI